MEETTVTNHFFFVVFFVVFFAAFFVVFAFLADFLAAFFMAMSAVTPCSTTPENYNKASEKNRACETSLWFARVFVPWDALARTASGCCNARRARRVTLVCWIGGLLCGCVFSSC